jgi:hypothetical protein
MKDEYSTVVAKLTKDPNNNYDNFKINEAKFDDPTNIFNQLYNDVETRDNIGEFSWYIYSGLFILALVSYNLAMISCK